MKSTRKIAVLTLVAGAIVFFWLAPGVNTAKEVRYTRIYEDTDIDASPKVTIDNVIPVTKDTVKHKSNKKIYKKESIEPKRKREVTAKMFSRAIQFEPELVAEDSTAKLMMNADSVVAIP